tara:strand:+ start:1344 stop:2072 length:729 start_codon:yes stop_codon:yes gene_type:complete
MKELLGIDLDETVVYLLRSFLGYYNSKHGTNFSEEDFHTYQWGEVLGIPQEQAYVEAEKYILERIGADDSDVHLGSQQNGYFGIEFVEGAIPALDLLSRFYELHGITDRNLLLEPDTHNISSYLYVEDGEEGSYFPQLPIPSDEGGMLILPNDRIHYARAEGKAKSQVCRELGITKLIEDNADIALDCARNGIDVFVLPRPWNRNMAEHHRVTRVNDWQEICDKLVPGGYQLPDLADVPGYV